MIQPEKARSTGHNPLQQMSYRSTWRWPCPLDRFSPQVGIRGFIYVSLNWINPLLAAHRALSIT